MLDGGHHGDTWPKPFARIPMDDTIHLLFWFFHALSAHRVRFPLLSFVQ